MKPWMKALSAWHSHPLLSRSRAGCSPCCCRPAVPCPRSFCLFLLKAQGLLSGWRSVAGCQLSAAATQRAGLRWQLDPISLTSARTPFPHRGWISLELTQLSWKLCLSRICGFQSAALTGTKPSPCAHRGAFPSAQQHSRELALQK